jgi:hypothetical protein
MSLRREPGQLTAEKGLMAERERDEEREERITWDIVVDAYGPEERAMGWYYYLDDTLSFPFLTRCRARRAISPLQVGDEVEVLRMAPEEECEHEMFVMMRWEREGLGVPLSQLEVVHADEQTRQAVEDWHYWVERGYQF